MMVKRKNIALVVMTAVFLCGFMLWSILKPTDAESVSERRPLASFPALSAASVSSGEFMSGFETYALDQFPLRDQFRTLKALTAFYVLGQKDNNKVYIEDGYASKLEYPLNTDSVEYAAGRFRFVYEQYLADKNMKVYLSVIPDKNYFMARQSGHPSIDYEAFIADMRERMDFAAYIDVTDLLELSDYYRTDTHWRQEKITDVARRLAAEMGVPASDEYAVKQADAPFYGVYYGQSALPLSPDSLYYLESEYLGACTVYDYETGAYLPVYDLAKTAGKDPYEMFLSGPKSLLTIENPNARTERELIIFRDSFGSSLAPLLAEGYGKITLVDIRYLSPEMLDRFITFDGQDVLFLYSVFVLNNSVTIK